MSAFLGLGRYVLTTFRKYAASVGVLGTCYWDQGSITEESQVKNSFPGDTWHQYSRKPFYYMGLPAKFYLYTEAETEMTAIMQIPSFKCIAFYAKSSVLIPILMKFVQMV